jgi:uncharacterized repeat protein (TIGR01451 family)
VQRVRSPRTWALPAVAAVVTACVLGGPAFAALTPTSAPLADSTFQGADGNQLTVPPLTDWGALQSAGRVSHSADDNAHDTTFAGGTEEGEPAEWRLTTESGGVTPGKANILDAWTSVDQPAGTGKTFLYLAFTRNAATGDTFLSFELNQDARLWTNPAGATIPCRTEGDILVSYEISGNSAEVFVRQWHTTTTDAATGCARTGTIGEARTVRPDVDVQGALNTAPIGNVLPGFFGAAIPGVQFGEAALDLNAILGPNFPAGCYAFGSIWMHSRSSHSYTSQMQDIVAPRPIDLRTCAAAGTKFFDLNANGQRDPGEPGIPGFQIFADYNDNGQLDPGEPSTVSDATGRYVLDDIRPPHGGAYRLRERVPLTRRRATNDWICSFPNSGTDGGFGRRTAGLGCGWGPIDPIREPYATNRDFGNWYPAQLTVRKVLSPESDPGRFDLSVNGTVVFASAQNGSTVTLDVPPGTYTASEEAVPGTDPALYTSTAECKLLTRRAVRRSGTVSASVALAAGGRATCTFRNVRTGFPAIAIDKSGPSIATAGDTLQYKLRVTNPGTVPIPKHQIEVTDAVCDHDPVRTDTTDGSGGDDTPDTLDPPDTWTYTCSHTTPEPGADCELRVVRNTATVTGPGDIGDSSTIITTLRCPDTPPPDPPDPPDPPIPPIPPDPPVPPQPITPIPVSPVVPGQPTVPGAVAPPLPRPPAAGRAAVAGVVAKGLAHCVTRIPRMTVRGTRISDAAVFVDGRLVRRLHPALLQRQATIPRLPRLPAGRHRVTVRVSFQLGSGSRPRTLTRVVRICQAVAPRFTG